MLFVCLDCLFHSVQGTLSLLLRSQGYFIIIIIFLIISTFTLDSGVYVQVCDMAMLRDAEVWSMNDPITQVLSIVPNRSF